MTNTFSKLQWGILSTAKIGESLIQPLNQSPRSNLVAVASRSINKAQEFAIRSGIPFAYGCYEALIDDPRIDVIYNALPNSLHYEWTVKALQAGKHVLCEKPFVTNLNEIDSIEEVAKSRNLIVFEGLKHLHHPRMLKIREMVDDGKLGTLELINCCFGFHLSTNDNNNFRLDPLLGGGALWDVGIYPISLAAFISQGISPVKAWASKLEGDTKVDTSLRGHVVFSNGMALQVSCGFSYPFRFQTTNIIGDRGIIQMIEPLPLEVKETNFLFAEPKGVKEINFPFINQFSMEITAMEECIIDGADPVVSLNLSRICLKIILALYESTESGQTVWIQ